MTTNEFRELLRLRMFVEELRGELRMGYGEGHDIKDMYRIIRARNQVYLKLTTSEEQQLMSRAVADYHAPHADGSVPALQNPGWKPIDTAPKDKSWILVWYGEVEEHGLASWADTFWIDWDGDSYGPPTHWQPLPSPPVAILKAKQMGVGE